MNGIFEAAYAVVLSVYEALGPCFLGFLNRSLQASVLVLAAVLFRLIFKKAPKILRFIFWGAAALRLLLPFSLESAFSLQPVRTVPADVTSLTASEFAQSYPAAEQALTPIAERIYADAFAEASVNPALPLSFIAGMVWLAGIGVMLFWALVSVLRLRLKMRQAVKENGRVMKCERVGSPFILGVFRPRIYLPFGLDETTERLVLAHEQAHISRRDHWIKPFAFLLLSVYWFNPALWAGYILLCRDIELLCDERVLREVGNENKKAYANALLSLSEPHRRLSACPLAFGEGKVSGRIKNVLSYKKPTLWILIAAGVTGAVICALLLTSPKTGGAGAGEFPQAGAFETKEVLYSVMYNDVLYIPPDAPRFFIAADGTLSRKDPYGDGEWKALGVLREAALSEEDYCALFPSDPLLRDGYDPQQTANKISRAWTAGNASDVWLLELKNGTLLLMDVVTPPTGREAQYLFQLRESDGLPGEEQAEQAIAAALLEDVKNGGYFSGECMTEGHILLGITAADKQPDRYYVYALTMALNYAIQDNELNDVSGHGFIPARFTLAPDGTGGYTVEKIDWPEDGERNADSIRELFPANLRSRALSERTADTENLRAQCERAAKAYAASLGRTLEITEDTYTSRRYLWKILDTDAMDVIEENRKNDPELYAFPDWVGNAEYLIDGERYVYTTDFDEATGTVHMKKTRYGDPEVLLAYDIDTAGNRITLTQPSGGGAYTPETTTPGTTAPETTAQTGE